MINLLFSGNEKVFDGALTELISITNKTKEAVTCYILTMDVSRIKKEYVPIHDEQIAFLNEVVQTKNRGNKVIKIDVTELYEKEFGHGKNENAYCTPYTLLRLLADLVPDMPDKLLYLDIDMMADKDISELYNIDIEEYEYAAVKESIKGALADNCKSAGLDLMLCMMTDNYGSGSYLLYAGDKSDCMTLIFNDYDEDKLISKLVSRKKQLLPKVIEALS